MQSHILLVEDDPKIREAIIDYFSEKAPEYTMDIAKSGLEGLNKIEENNYDLILLDVMLPQMSGFDLIVKIRKSMDVPVIFMTARTSEEDRLYGYELGCDDYVCKPFSIAELLAKVNALIKRSKGTVLDDILVCGNIQLHKRALTVRVAGEEIELPLRSLKCYRCLWSGRAGRFQGILCSTWYGEGISSVMTGWLITISRSSVRT